VREGGRETDREGRTQMKRRMIEGEGGKEAKRRVKFI